MTNSNRTSCNSCNSNDDKPSCTCPINFGSFFNTIAQSAGPTGDITFNNPGPFKGIRQTPPGSAVITIDKDGTYQATYEISSAILVGGSATPFQFALFLNGSEVAGSRYNGSTGDVPNVGQVMFVAAEGDLLTLKVNIAGLVLTAPTNASTNASLIINRVK